MAMIGENYLFKENDKLGEIMYQINRDSITPVKVPAGETLSHVAKVLNMHNYYLKKINAHLKNGRVPNQRGYRINIPTSKVNAYYNQYASQKYAQR